MAVFVVQNPAFGTEAFTTINMGQGSDSFFLSIAMAGAKAVLDAADGIPASTVVGIDVRRVVETGIAPGIDTGIAHREAGVGQIGAGLTEAPLECFVAAVEALAASA